MRRKNSVSPAAAVVLALRFLDSTHRGFTYYGSVNITLSIDEKLVKEVRKIAVERDTTLNGLVRAYLEELAVEHARSGRKRREGETLERSFERFQFRVGKRSWKRGDLYART